jgi:hypothetical protein
VTDHVLYDFCFPQGFSLTPLSSLSPLQQSKPFFPHKKCIHPDDDGDGKNRVMEAEKGKFSIFSTVSFHNPLTYITFFFSCTRSDALVEIP